MVFRKPLIKTTFFLSLNFIRQFTQHVLGHGTLVLSTALQEYQNGSALLDHLRCEVLGGGEGG